MKIKITSILFWITILTTNGQTDTIKRDCYFFSRNDTATHGLLYGKKVVNYYSYELPFMKDSVLVTEINYSSYSNYTLRSEDSKTNVVALLIRDKLPKDTLWKINSLTKGLGVFQNMFYRTVDFAYDGESDRYELYDILNGKYLFSYTSIICLNFERFLAYQSSSSHNRTFSEKGKRVGEIITYDRDEKKVKKFYIASNNSDDIQLQREPEISELYKEYEEYNYLKETVDLDRIANCTYVNLKFSHSDRFYDMYIPIINGDIFVEKSIFRGDLYLEK